jgi:hypothetical protein
VRIDWHRLRPADLLAGGSGLLLAIALFLPWYGFGGMREDAWQALTLTEIPAALAALGALALVVATVTQRSPAVPLAIAVATATIALVAVIAIAVRAGVTPAGASERCYGLWVGLAAALLVLVAALLSLRDERPAWGVPVAFE